MASPMPGVSSPPAKAPFFTTSKLTALPKSTTTALPSLRVFLIDSGEQPELLEHRIVWPSPSDFRLSEEAQRLANVRVGIVGLGSMGSKIAVSLARSGVRRFLLVDDDYLAPGNMVRRSV